ncbi:MAG TPA: DUF952 domain-containing protein, partial [Pirellulales bacterium]
GPIVRGGEYPFQKTGSRVYFDDIPIWLVQTDWTAVAEIRVIAQSRTAAAVEGKYRVLRVYDPADANTAWLTKTFRRMFAAGADPFIYMLMSTADFKTASSAGVWGPPSLATEKFVHASPANQLTRVANKHYKQFDEVVVVVLNPERIKADVEWEPATGGLYPHIFGPVDMDATVRTKYFKKDAGGLYNITPDLLV